MVSINYATREVSCKIVYYGPGLSGKTTNLQYVHAKVPSDTKGKLISLATDADRTLYFDFLPINIGTINGFAAKFQLYTVPGQVYYNATRKLVLRGTDGLVFVADSQPDKMDENVESLNNLKENLAEYGYNLNEIPIVIQYNKQDLPGVLSPEEIRPTLNPNGWPEFKASATEGFGVFDTLKCILKMVLDRARSSGTSQAKQPGAPAAQQTAPPPQAPAVQPPPAASVPPPQPVYQQQAPPPQPQQPPPPPPPQQRPEYSDEPLHKQPGVHHQTQRTTTTVVERPAPRHEQYETYEREAALMNQQQAPPEQPQPQPPPPQPEPPQSRGYRPFPGNSEEDEQRMRHSIYDQPEAATTQPPPAPQAHTSNHEHTSPTETSPQMAPPNKVKRPKKKRSFFKRLFGLK